MLALITMLLTTPSGHAADGHLYGGEASQLEAMTKSGSCQAKTVPLSSVKGGRVSIFECAVSSGADEQVAIYAVTERGVMYASNAARTAKQCGVLRGMRDSVVGGRTAEETRTSGTGPAQMKEQMWTTTTGQYLLWSEPVAAAGSACMMLLVESHPEGQAIAEEVTKHIPFR